MPNPPDDTAPFRPSATGQEGAAPAAEPIAEAPTISAGKDAPRRSPAYAEADTVHAGAPGPTPVPTVVAANGVPPVFKPGEILSGRYRVVRFVAAGGMGQVFEVHDQALDERLALKTLHTTLADHSPSARQFKAEVQLARRVTHANVCRIYDLGSHTFADGRVAAFLTMELLRGETLRERIARGPIPAAEAVDLAGQLARGLAAAHAAGIVHRDFKSDNVILVPGRRGAPRAVITDFGVAVTDDDEEGVRGFVGTPAYIAPELVKGGEASDAADIYSYGVVLHEMLSGRLPFTGATPLEIALVRLGQAPPALGREAPPQLVALTAACLLLEPETRLAAASPLLAQLRQDAGSPPRARRRLLVLGAVLLAVLGTLLAVVVLQPARHALVLPALDYGVAPARTWQRVLVRTFTGPAPEDRWLGYVLREGVRAELSDAPRMRTVALAAAMVAESLWATPGRLPEPAQVVALAHATSAGLVVEGEYHRQGDRIVASARVLDGNDGHELGRGEASGPEPMAVIASLGLQLRRLVHLERQTPVSTGLLPDAAEQEAYGEILDATATRNLRRALNGMRALLRTRPTFAGNLALLLSVQAHLTVERQLDLGRLAEVVSQLPLDEGELFRAQIWIAQGEVEKGVALCRARAATDPGDFQLQLDLGECLSDARLHEEALMALAQLRRFPQSRYRELEIEVAELNELLKMRHFEAALTKARTCAERAATDHDVPTQATCLGNGANAARNLSRWDESLDMATATLTLTMQHEVPRQTTMGAVNLALDVRLSIAMAQDDLVTAEAIARDKLAEAQLDGEDQMIRDDNLQLAIVRANAGQLVEARARLENEVVPAYLDATGRPRDGFAETEAGAVALMAGDVATAARYTEDGLRLYIAQQDSRLVAYARCAVAETKLAQDELDAARELVSLAIRYRDQAQLGRSAAVARIELAEIELARGDLDAVEGLLRPLLGADHAELWPADRAAIWAILANALFARGRGAEALAAAEQSWALHPTQAITSRNLHTTRLRATVLGLAGDSGDRRRAEIELTNALRSAHTAGYLFEELELELALARLDVAAGRRARGRAAAARVGRLADQQGLLELARRARVIAAR
jgi:tetratricopeptide (TPR) repeat protein